MIVGVTQQATLSVQRVSGGAQRSAGVFLQDVFTPTPKLTLTLNARLDHWLNYDGHFIETNVSTGLPTANNKPTLPDKDDTVVSPRVAALYHLTDKITAWGAYNTGFRAPTLTELYRQFSVGAITTRPNDQLNPERLKGGELGFNVAPASNLTARVTWFDNRIEDPVSNVTLSTTACSAIWATRIYAYRPTSSICSGRLACRRLHLHHARGADGGEVPTLTGKTLAQVLRIAPRLHTEPKYANVTLGIQTLGRLNDDQNVQFTSVRLVAAGTDNRDRVAGPPPDLMVSHDFNSNLQAFRDATYPISVLRSDEPVDKGHAHVSGGVRSAGQRGRPIAEPRPHEGIEETVSRAANRELGGLIGSYGGVRGRRRRICSPCGPSRGVRTG